MSIIIVIFVIFIVDVLIFSLRLPLFASNHENTSFNMPFILMNDYDYDYS